MKGRLPSVFVYNRLMFHCLFATDLHGRIDRYEKFFAAIAQERPRAVFLGGDLLPHHARRGNWFLRS